MLDTKGRLSGLYFLPAHLDGAIGMAIDHAIVSNRSTKEKARQGLNAALVTAGVKPISVGAWARFLKLQKGKGIHHRWRLQSGGEMIELPMAQYEALLQAANAKVECADPER